jgi:hypothetical protein
MATPLFPFSGHGKVNSYLSHRPWPIVFAALFLAFSFTAITAHAGAVYTFLVIDPATTAGAGVDTSSGFSVTSTRSGAGTWHLYAVDDLDSSFGIRSFNVKLSPGEGGSITTVCNRTPNTSYATGPVLGPDAGIASSGFNDIRGVYGTAISGGQGPLNTAQVGGLGVTAGNFGAQTPGQSFSTTSGQWGVYADPYTSGQLSTGDTRSAVFLGEGSYTGAPPTVDLTTPMAKGGTGVNTWINAGITRSDLALDLSSSNPFNCPACATGNDPNLVSRAVAPPPAQIVLPPPPPAALPAPPTPPLVAPAPATGGPYKPPVATSDPQISPVAPDDPQPEIQPPGEYPQSTEIAYYNDIWVSLPIGEPISGVEHDGLVYYTYQTIDSAASVIPNLVVPMKSPHGGLQAAMMTALTGLPASEVFAFDGSNQFNVAPTLLFTSLDATGADLTDRVSFESAVAAPEPATLALVGLASIALAGMVCRRRSG